MTKREHVTRATGSAFDTTRLGKHGALVRPGAHTMSGGKVDDEAFGSSRALRRHGTRRTFVCIVCGVAVSAQG